MSENVTYPFRLFISDLIGAAYVLYFMRTNRTYIVCKIDWKTVFNCCTVITITVVIFVQTHEQQTKSTLIGAQTAFNEPNTFRAIQNVDPRTDERPRNMLT